MGAFFTNLLVRCADAPSERAQHAVEQAIRAYMGSQGLTEAAAGEVATRVVLVAAQPGPWISIYDSATESQDVSLLDELGKALSARAAEVVLTVLVHDSDVLDLRLFRAEKRIDAFSNWPGYFAARPKPRDPLRTGRAQRRAAWSPLLVKDHRVDEIETAWASGKAPEEILTTMAPLVGWDARFVNAGFSSITPAIRAASTELRFRMAGAARSGARPPAWGHEGGDASVTASAGDPFVVMMVAHNVGGPMKGVSIVVWGEAVERGIVTVSSVRAVVGSPAHPGHAQAQLVESDGLRVATLHDVSLPEGYDSPAAALAAAAGAPEEGLDRWLRTRFEIDCDAVAVKRGEADLHLGLVPLQNPERGQTSWTTRVKVRAKG
jgi:hypothetical protein